MTAEEKSPPPQLEVTADGIPNVMVQQAEAAVAAANDSDDIDDDRKEHWAQTRRSMDSLNTSVYESSIASVDTEAIRESDTANSNPPNVASSSASQTAPPSRVAEHDTEDDIPDVPPPSYGEHYGSITGHQDDLDTKAVVLDDGRVNINIDQHTRKLASLLGPALQRETELADDEEPPPAYIPPSLGGTHGLPPPPPMNVVIQVVGSRGDVQPFVALGKVLRERYGHRVRLATHKTFREFVTSNGLEFFNIGGDPAKLMAFMVRNPGLMPDISSVQEGEIAMRRNEIREMLRGCWRSCYEVGDGTGPLETDANAAEWNTDGNNIAGDDTKRPFVADAIIANPPSFAHLHIAEKLGIPLHIMFTMPYSPTQAFPHPLANIQSSNADPNITNYISYTLVELLTWQGLGDVINRFRNLDLGLDDIGIWSAQGLHRLKIPHTYCWSPALIPKPSDWRRHINISGFFFLDSAAGYTPPPELSEFLKSGPPPVYIGFGSIVLDDPNGMTELIFEAVRRSGQRAIVSQGWGGMGGNELDKPDDVLMLGNCPHDWLFDYVSCVVHHGGAGTTAIGIKAGKPTVIVPFFGDQPFWGAMVAKAGAGPDPIPHKQLTAEGLAEAIKFCLLPETLDRAKELGLKLAEENGSETGAQSFHQFLKTDDLRCSIAPSRNAVWRVKRTQIKLSALAACTLANAGLLDFKKLKLFRPREYDTDPGPYDPVTGGVEAIFGTLSAVMGGVMHLPLQGTKKSKKSKKGKEPAEGEASSSKENEAASFQRESSYSSQHEGTVSEDGASASRQPEHSGLFDSDAVSLTGSMNSESTTKAAPSETTTESTVRSGSTNVSAKSGASTPATSRSRSSFNVAESLGKLDETSPLPHRSRRSSSRRSESGVSGHAEGQNQSEEARRTSNNPINFPNRHLQVVQNTGEGIVKIVEAGMKSPMGFTNSLARGFHNAPRLYGDTTVRPKERITGFTSGLRAAGKSFGLGMYDGITGLVTQPMSGLAKGGAAGFVKGIGKGIGGIALKPGAAIFGLPGYTMKGIYAELFNVLGSSVQNYIIAARTAQGYEQWNASSTEERDDIIKRYLRLQRDGRATAGSQREAPESLLAQPRASIRPDNILESPPPYQPPAVTPSSAQTVSTGSTSEAIDSLHLQHPEESVPSTGAATSTEEHDAELEAAIRASLAERARNPNDYDTAEDEELRRAMAASLNETHSRARDEELERALAASLAEHKGKQTAVEQLPPSYDASTSTPGFQPDQKTAEEKREEELVLEYQRKQSLLEAMHRANKRTDVSATAGPAHNNNNDDDEDEEFRRAVELSLKENK